ncbi:MAG: hypothetical protein H0W02_12590 [Ktedonobacteraceae bacterium]|nr:hypothetical protein [Ktedonobacteraceae bacterium]
MPDIIATLISIHSRPVLLMLSIILATSILPTCEAGPRVPNPATRTAAPAIARVTIIAQDDTCEMPGSVPAGLAAIKLVNAGRQPHQATLARLNAGTQLNQVQALLQSSALMTSPRLTFVGGPATIQPGASQEVLLLLAPGQYVALCFVPGPDRLAHITTGLIASFTVTPDSYWKREGVPGQHLAVTLKDYSIGMPASITTEPIMVQVTNTGQQPHEMQLARLALGVTKQDVLAFSAAPAAKQPPFELMGGMGTLAPGTTGWVMLHLAPGNYVALCSIPAPATNTAHLFLGMIASFSAQ